MNKFLNEMLTKGAILGCVMLLSYIVEQSMLVYGGTMPWVWAMTVEALVVGVIYIWLLYRFTKRYSEMVLAERKELPYFSYMSGLSYTICVASLAGVIVGVGGYMFRHFVIGNQAFVDATLRLLQEALSHAVIPANMAGTYEQLFTQVKNQPEPSLITTLVNSIWNYMLSGLLFGLFIAGAVKRNPSIFNNNEQNEQ